MAMYAQIIYPLPFYRVLRVLHPEITGSLWQRVESFIEVVPVGGKHLETLYGGRRNTSRRVVWTSRTSRVKIIKYKEANTNEDNEEKPTKQISTKNRTTKYWNINPQLLFLARLMNIFSASFAMKQWSLRSTKVDHECHANHHPVGKNQLWVNSQQHDIWFSYWFACWMAVKSFAWIKTSHGRLIGRVWVVMNPKANRINTHLKISHKIQEWKNRVVWAKMELVWKKRELKMGIFRT